MKKKTIALLLTMLVLVTGGSWLMLKQEREISKSKYVEKVFPAQKAKSRSIITKKEEFKSITSKDSSPETKNLDKVIKILYNGVLYLMFFAMFLEIVFYLFF